MTAQRALSANGYNPGPADGVMGPRTEAAVRQFQQEEGLKETGRLDGDTMARLESRDYSRLFAFQD